MIIQLKADKDNLNNYFQNFFFLSIPKHLKRFVSILVNDTVVQALPNKRKGGGNQRGHLYLVLTEHIRRIPKEDFTVFGSYSIQFI